VKWHLPFARNLTRSRALADACNVIGDALESGRTLDWAIYEASEVPTNFVMQAQLRRWAKAVLSGLPVDAAARQAGLPELVVGMAASAQAASDLPQVLRFLARYYEGRFSRAVHLLRGAAIPGLAIFFGIIVLIIARGMFEPMIEMINRLSPNMRVL
jgi:type II secretory pathway component PulF